MVRLIKLTPFDSLWKQFTSEDLSQDFLRIMVSDIHREVSAGWHDKIFSDAQVVKEIKLPSGDRGPAPPQGPEGLPTPEEM